MASKTYDVNIKDLSFALLHSWGADTAKGNWREDIPSLNQCAVTALVVQDFFGGELLRCPLGENDSHYWNNTDEFGEIDLTFSQFAVDHSEDDLEQTVVRDRDYVLSFPDTKMRYEILKKRVEKHLNGKK
jgi:hypothetical protein